MSFLDPVREQFAQVYHATGNASQAFRTAKPKSMNWKPNVVNSKASTMLAEGKVQERLRELRGEAAEKHEVTIDSLTKMAKDAYDLAMKDDVQAPAAAISAVLAIGKLHGLIVDKKEVTKKRDAADFADAELYEIARMGRPRVDQAQAGSDGPDSVH